MLKNPILIFTFLLIVLYLTDCKTINNVNNMPFSLKSAYYQSWVLNENERGTDIILMVKNVSQGIRFDSILFRGVKLPVFTSMEKGRIILKSVLPIGRSRLKTGSEVTGEPDQLIYRINNERKSLLLGTLERKKTRSFTAKLK